MATAETPNYLDPKVLERIKRLDVRARQVVEGFITGQHKSPYNGVAIEFAGHREYAPGDEIKHIDWKVWSKTDRFYIKEYEEETNLKTTLVIDCSKSMAYKGDGWRKFDYAATAGASLAHLLQHQGDAVGMVTFNTKVKDVLPPSARQNHLKEMVHVLSETEPDDKTDVGDVFLEIVPQIKTRGMVVIISDLFGDIDTLRTALQQLRLRKHEVVVFHVMDRHELEFPFEDNTRFIGLESDDEVQADPRALKKTYLEIVGRYQKDVRKMCDKTGVDYQLFDTGEPLDALLSRYLAFRKHHTRKGRAAR
jgi:uncharacterized protein (DUF58 family)